MNSYCVPIYIEFPEPEEIRNTGRSVELKEAAFGGGDYRVIYCGGEELRARHPIVEFEWCAGGQQRVAREVT